MSILTDSNLIDVLKEVGRNLLNILKTPIAKPVSVPMEDNTRECVTSGLNFIFFKYTIWRNYS